MENAYRLLPPFSLDSSRFARRYLGNHIRFLFLRILRWFNSPGLPLSPILFRDRYLPYGRWVAPFGNLRIKTCLRLPEAYRSLPRPSSLSFAKASTVRPFFLDHKWKIVKEQTLLFKYILISKQCQVEIERIELSTSAVQVRRSPNWAISPRWIILQLFSRVKSW